MPKSASTSLEAAFGSFAQVTTGGTPAYKHLNYRMFSRYVAPLLAARGHDRDSYEVLCLFRHPIDWLDSWWRYRSRSQLAKPANRNHGQYAGNMTFDQFAKAYMNNAPPARVRPPADFVATASGEIGVDRIYRLEDIDELVKFLNQRVGKAIELPRKNISPPRKADLSAATRSALERHMTAEFEIYEHATIGHIDAPSTPVSTAGPGVVLS